MAFTSGDRLGVFEILGLIGKGGMGEVYRARDTKLGRDVAIKVLPAALAQHPDRLARFEREAKVLASLNHPNIAVIYGLEDRAIVMELVEGPTLEDRLKAGPLPLQETLEIARQVAEALEAAHDKGIVHRDLKPANIKAAPEGPIKVLDFGLATAVGAGERESADPSASPTLTIGATEAGMILGTAAYMSPEQASGKKVDKRADIYAMGVLTFEMLTGRLPFIGSNRMEVAYSTVNAPIPSAVKLNAALPDELDQLLAKVLAKDPAQADALDAVLASLAEGLRSVTVLLHPYMPSSTRKLLAAIGRPDVSYAGATLAANGWGGDVSAIEPLFPKPS